MVRIRVDPSRRLEPQLRGAVDAIRSGGVVAFPTDTLYGLAADPHDAAAVAAVFALKGRGSTQPLPLIAGDLEQAMTMAVMEPAAVRLARAFWPGPLTLLLPMKVSLAGGVGSPDGLVGIRVPDSEIARALAGSVGSAITATSANRSGASPTPDPDVVASTLPDIAVLVDGGTCRGGLPSTIVDVSGAPRLVREGAIPWSRVLEFSGAPGSC